MIKLGDQMIRMSYDNEERKMRRFWEEYTGVVKL